MMTPPLTKSLALLALCLALAGTAAQAQSSTWNGEGANANWNNTGNWDGGTLPITTGTASFGEAGSYTVNRNTTGSAATALVFTEGADEYTFNGNRLELNNTPGASITNASGETVTFQSGLLFNHWNARINTNRGDIVVENGVVGAGSYTPVKDGIGTLTIHGADGVLANGDLRIFAGTLILDGYAQNFGGAANQVAPTANNTAAIEFVGAATGGTTITKTSLILNAGNGAAAQIRLNSNGGDGVALNFNAESSAFSRFAPATLNVDLSSSAANSVSFASVGTSTATAMTGGIFRWGTVTDTVATGFATMSGTNLVRNTDTALFTGSDTTSTTGNYHVGNGATTLTATRAVGSLTIHAENGGTMSGGILQTGGVLMQEGTLDYTLNNNLVQEGGGSGRLVIHQYSTAGSLIFNGAVHNGSNVGSTLMKTGPGTVVVGSSGTVGHAGITYLQGGRFVVDGAITRSSEVRVFDTATLKGSGSIGTLAASAVHLYGGGTLAGSTDAALAVNGTLALDSYSHFAMTLTYSGADYVDVSGAITLDTEADLALTLAAAPTPGLNVPLLKGSGITGSFATVNGESFGPAGTFTLAWNSQDYQFQLFQNSNQAWVQALPAVPEPSTALLAGVGAAFLLLRRRLRGAA